MQFVVPSLLAPLFSQRTFPPSFPGFLSCFVLCFANRQVRFFFSLVAIFSFLKGVSLFPYVFFILLFFLYFLPQKNPAPLDPPFFAPLFFEVWFVSYDVRVAGIPPLFFPPPFFRTCFGGVWVWSGSPLHCSPLFQRFLFNCVNTPLFFFLSPPSGASLF